MIFNYLAIRTKDEKFDYPLITPSVFQPPGDLKSVPPPHDEIERIVDGFRQLKDKSLKIPIQKIIDEKAEMLSNKFLEEIPDPVFQHDQGRNILDLISYKYPRRIVPNLCQLFVKSVNSMKQVNHMKIMHRLNKLNKHAGLRQGRLNSILAGKV